MLGVRTIPIQQKPLLRFYVRHGIVYFLIQQNYCITLRI